MSGGPIVLSRAQRSFIELTVSAICNRGGWPFRCCAAATEEDHVHVLLDADAATHGKSVRRWLKRWLSDALTETFGAPAVRWRAKGGSTKLIDNESYLQNATRYIEAQQTTSA